MPKPIFYIVSAAFILLLGLPSCKKDKIPTDSDVRLKFYLTNGEELDTLMFDTVFVTAGSATQVFTVHNTESRPINISKIWLGNGNASYYRLNVNGTAGKSFTDVEIGAHDSIFVFAEVTIPDPNSPNIPFVVTDSLMFETNGNIQDVKLVAWGQRAHFHYYTPNTPPLYYFACNDVWTNDLPHVVYGYGLVKTNCTLTIQKGVRVHFHNNSGIVVMTGGKILVNGEKDSVVTFQGDRLGDEFKDIPGQWDRIILSNLDTNFGGSAGPKGNVFDYAVIKNGYVGIQSDTVAQQHQPAAILNNCILKNFASTALFGRGSNIQANNSVFANCGEYCAALYYGGDYRFLHCTFANYWNNGNRQTPSIYMQNYYDVVRPLDSAYFGNCIIYGNLDNEIGLDSANESGDNFRFKFDHTLIKISNQTSTSNGNQFAGILKNVEPSFSDRDNNIYELLSGAGIDDGDLNITNTNLPILSTDIKGNPRPKPATAPDMGAYELQ
jgi:hypothetical protein